jgi:cytochrome c
VKAINTSTIIVASALVLASQVAQAQDAAAGKAVFAQCTACHTVDGTESLGPTLKGVVGRKAGSAEGFRYSRAMKATTYSWDAKILDTYLTDPAKTIPGNVMPFSGVADAKQRADLIAYLATLK